MTWKKEWRKLFLNVGVFNIVNFEKELIILEIIILL
jgi:hypothetical protein